MKGAFEKKLKTFFLVSQVFLVSFRLKNKLAKK